ncbi:MAG: hypothetical protein LBM96_07835, partial [Methanobrevibacter sp.]|nr:hypothetical protein [Candidatus Methanoflexus mossambicus]
RTTTVERTNLLFCISYRIYNWYQVKTLKKQEKENLNHYNGSKTVTRKNKKETSICFNLFNGVADKIQMAKKYRKRKTKEQNMRWLKFKPEKKKKKEKRKKY